MKLIADFIELGEWYCPHCGVLNNGPFRCKHCGEDY